MATSKCRILLFGFSCLGLWKPILMVILRHNEKILKCALTCNFDILEIVKEWSFKVPAHFLLTARIM